MHKYPKETDGAISLFIPCYNAEKTLLTVLRRIPEGAWKNINTVYLIDDGSTDTTVNVMKELVAVYPRCLIVCQKTNGGYGETVKHGLRLCSEDGCLYAVCLHADGQYPPESIVTGIEKMKRDAIDLLQGSRIASGTALRGGMPLYKYVFGRLLTILENRVFGLSQSDFHSGFLIYSRQVITTIRFQTLSSSFDFDLEVIASVRAAGMVVGEIPIPARYADEVSYLNPVTYGIRVLGVLVKYRCGVYAPSIKQQRSRRE